MLIDSCKGVCHDSVTALYKIYLGKTLNLQEEYAKARTEFEEAIQLMQNASNENGKAFALNSLAEVYRRNGKYNKAAQQLDLVLKLIARGHVNKYNEAYCYNRYAAIENELGRDSIKIRAYSNKAMEIADQYGYLDIKAGSLNELGFFEERYNKVDAAAQYYKRALELEQKLNRPIYVASVICNLARILARDGQYAKAEQYAREGIEIMEPIPVSNTKAFLYKVYSDALFKQNKFKESREALNEHLKYQTKVLEDYYSKSLAELETKFELKKKNDLIELEHQKAVTAQQDADKKRTQILYAISGAILLAALVILLWLTYRRIRTINLALTDALKRKNDLLKEVNHRVKNNMQIVTSLLEMESEQLKESHEKEVFRNSINRIQTLAMAHQNLYSTENYTSIDLAKYLQTLATHIADKKEYTLKLDLDPGLQIDIEKAQAVGFILNELMANSMKYAWDTKDTKEKMISLQVKETQGELLFHYADNGQGMKNEIHNGSMGMSLIRSFVKRQLNGTLEMFNDEGANAIIKFRKNVNL